MRSTQASLIGAYTILSVSLLLPLRLIDTSCPLSRKVRSNARADDARNISRESTALLANALTTRRRHASSFGTSLVASASSASDDFTPDRPCHNVDTTPALSHCT